MKDIKKTRKKIKLILVSLVFVIMLTIGIIRTFALSYTLTTVYDLYGWDLPPLNIQLPWTNQNVPIHYRAIPKSDLKRIKLPDGSYTTNNTGVYYATKNGTYTFIFENKNGGTSTGSMTVSRIDKTKPTVSFSPNGNNTYATSHSTKVSVSDSASGVASRQYVWTTSTTEPTSGWKSFSNGATLTTPSTHGNNYLWIRATDVAGNVQVTRSSAFRLDLEAPSHISSSITGARYVDGDTFWVRPGDVLTITYRQRDAHSGNQRSYIRFNGNSQDVRYYHNYSSGATNLQAVNTSFVNTNSVQVQSVNRTEHNTSTGYGTTQWKVKLNTSGHNYNVQYYYRDNLGNNRGYTTVANARVDGVAPTLNISQTPSAYTNGSITLTATGNDTLSGIKRIKRPDGTWVNGGSASYTVTSNGSYTFVAEDNVGNTTTKNILVTNIDKVDPTASLIYEKSESGNQMVIKIVANDDASGVKSILLPNGIEVKQSNTSYTVSKNGTYHFIVTDNAGNSATITATVSDLDETPPTLNLLTSTDEWRNDAVYIIIMANDENGIQKIVMPDESIVDNSFAIFEVTENGIYTFTAYDKAGNSTTKSIEVTNIDWTLPTLNIRKVEETEKSIDVRLEYGDM